MKIAMSDILRKGIVFPQYISAKRMIMMSSILKQCCRLGWQGQYEQDPLIEAVETDNIPKLHGRNVLMGLMDWNLYTHEDSCVISNSLAKKLTTYKNIIEIVENKTLPTLHISLGDIIRPHHPIATVKDINGDDKVYRSSNSVDAIVDNIQFETELIEDTIINRFKIYLVAEYKCGVGSKVSNLHSVKNIVSCVLPDDRMPVMQDGTSLEMIISPTSISNRKNPSLVLESMLGMYLRELGQIHKIDVPSLQFKQFDTSINFNLAANYLESVGLPENCMFRLKNGTKGHVFRYSTLVGYIFLMRLHHHAEDKIKSSNEITLDHRNYPQLGVGAQRLNRDEMEVLWTYGAHNIIKEALDLNKNTSFCNTLHEYLQCIGYKYE